MFVPWQTTRIVLLWDLSCPWFLVRSVLRQLIYNYQVYETVVNDVAQLIFSLLLEAIPEADAEVLLSARYVGPRSAARQPRQLESQRYSSLSPIRERHSIVGRGGK